MDAMTAKTQMKVTQYIGLTAAGQKFIRRHTSIPGGHTTTGIWGEEMRLDQWKHTHPGSHIKMIREQVQCKPLIYDTMYIFTYLEVEYACGCVEQMFKWREQMDPAICNFFYDHKRGIVSM